MRAPNATSGSTSSSRTQTDWCGSRSFAAGLFEPGLWIERPHVQPTHADEQPHYKEAAPSLDPLVLGLVPDPDHRYLLRSDQRTLLPVEQATR